MLGMNGRLPLQDGQVIKTFANLMKMDVIELTLAVELSSEKSICHLFTEDKRLSIWHFHYPTRKEEIK
ncbi:hypothetical protein JOC94_000862 [Bacillus thermophilus]|uniref:Uncharacterized protein n=1 Tax=Siminovitchia thermophila TaxID=1245522 RepID=A0ABS2R2P0_9BACI|nr:hypothetical protein [Siminovitchia thermophila]